MDYFDLGAHCRRISTASEAAQIWFDRGLVWIYGYNHEAAIRCFEAALKADADCAMAQWGIAYSLGPNYNKPWEVFQPEERRASLEAAQAALAAAQAASGAASPVEAALIDALTNRYAAEPDIEDFAPCHDAFADAMRKVHAAYPDDLDVTAIFAEALMNRTPWGLWDLPGGHPAEGASTLEARAALERAFDSDPAAWDHPGLLHLYIHLMEMSPTPEAALRHGDRLGGLVPDSGHLVHMATHIDLLCGDYASVVERNHRAAIIDRGYEAMYGGKNFYTLYRIHNLHFEIYGALFLGQRTPALAAADELIRQLPDAVVQVYPDLFEVFVSTKPHVLIRFGMWEALLKEPIPQNRELYSYSIALMHYARTVALANLGRLDEAETERAAFEDALARIPDERMLFNNTARDVLRVAQEMMLGELKYKSGHTDAGLEHLRTAARLDDGLLYEEPWAWMLPARHALGALLLDAGRYEEAESVYRADLGLDGTLARACQHPRNVWSLNGLHECLAQRGEGVEIVHIRQQLDQALARAEVPIRASCFCRRAAA